MARTVTFELKFLFWNETAAPIKMPDMAKGNVLNRAALIQLFTDAILFA